MLRKDVIEKLDCEGVGKESGFNNVYSWKHSQVMITNQRFDIQYLQY